jgi:hypothetical protein
MNWNRDARLVCVATATLASMLNTTCSFPVGRDAPDDVTVEGSADGIAVLGLLELASTATGEVYFYDSREMADAMAPLRGKLVVPREKFPALLDECLSDAGFVDVEGSIAGRTAHSIRSLRSTWRSNTNLKTDARNVPLESLESRPDRKSLVTISMICSSSTLARQIACPILCQFFSDSATESTRSIEGTPIVVMTGRTDNVVRFAAMGRRIVDEFGSNFEAAETAKLEARIRELEESAARLEREFEAAGKR